MNERKNITFTTQEENMTETKSKKGVWKLTRKATAAIITAACLSVVSVVSVVAYQQHWIQGMFPKSVMDDEITGLMDELSTGVDVSVESDLFDVTVLGAAADERELLVSLRFTPTMENPPYDPETFEIMPGWEVGTDRDWDFPNGIWWDYSEEEHPSDGWESRVPEGVIPEENIMETTTSIRAIATPDGSYETIFRLQLARDKHWSEAKPFQIRLEAMDNKPNGTKYGNIGTMTAMIDTEHLSKGVCVESNERFSMGWATYTVADHTTITPFGVTFSGKTRVLVSPSIPTEITLLMQDGSELVLRNGSYGYGGDKPGADGYVWDANFNTESVINPSDVRAMIVRDQEIPITPVEAEDMAE